ncbi:MAG: tetratricopeptide repeat protein, partial [Deltaproteobacteria bacterium]
MFRKVAWALVFAGVTLTLWSCRLHPVRTPTSGQAPKSEATEIGPYYYYTRSRLMRSRGEVGGAIELLREAAERDPDSIFLKKELVQLYLRHNDYHSALTIAEQLVEKDPKHVPSLIMLGSIYSALNRHTEAILV